MDVKSSNLFHTFHGGQREASMHARPPVLPHACFISFITRPLCWSRNTIFTQFLFPLPVFSSHVLQWFTGSDTDGSPCSCVSMGGGWNIEWPMILASLSVHLWQARRHPLHQQCLCCRPAPQPEPRVLRWGGRLSWLYLPHLFLIVLYHAGFFVVCVVLIWRNTTGESQVLSQWKPLKQTLGYLFMSSAEIPSLTLS